MNHRTTEDPAFAVESLDPLEAVMRYHQETKHYFLRYTRSLNYLDWANRRIRFVLRSDTPNYSQSIVTIH